MSNIGQYILSIVSAAVITSIVSRLSGDVGSVSKFVKLFTGIFLVIMLITPLKDFSISDISGYFTDVETDAMSINNYAESLVKSETETYIKEKTEAYILDKASDFDLDIAVAVEVSPSDIPLPVMVEIQGLVSPYSKQQLSKIISNDLGIPKEKQVWISKQLSEKSKS